jgi:hypothetical protein
MLAHVRTYTFYVLMESPHNQCLIWIFLSFPHLLGFPEFLKSDLKSQPFLGLSVGYR